MAHSTEETGGNKVTSDEFELLQELHKDEVIKATLKKRIEAKKKKDN